MNYVWEIILKAKDNNVSEGNLFFKQPKEYSPYYEQSFFELDKSSIETGGEIEINALYRYDKIFNKLLMPDLNDHVELRKYLFDIAVHFLASVDLYSGLSRQDVYCLKIKESIEMGQYGNHSKKTFENLKQIDKEYILLDLLKQLKLGSSLSIARSILTKIYPNMMIYQMKSEKNLILLYLGMENTDWEEKRLALILDLFLPLEYKTRIFWENHFGVISVDDTMILGNIELF